MGQVFTCIVLYAFKELCDSTGIHYAWGFAILIVTDNQPQEVLRLNTLADRWVSGALSLGGSLIGNEELFLAFIRGFSAWTAKDIRFYDGHTRTKTRKALVPLPA